MPVKIDPAQFKPDTEGLPESGQITTGISNVDQPNIFHGLTQGYGRGFTAQGYDPQIPKGEEIPATIGDILGTITANTAPWLIGGPATGIPVNAGYAGARNLNQQMAQGTPGNKLNYGQAASHAGLAAVTAALPAAAGGSILTRGITGAGLGAVTGAAGNAIDQYNSHPDHHVNLTTPDMLWSAGSGLGLGAIVGAGSKVLPDIYQNWKTSRAGLPATADALPPLTQSQYAHTNLPEDIHGPYANIHGPDPANRSAEIVRAGGPLALPSGDQPPAGYLPSRSSASQETPYVHEINPLEKFLQGRVEFERTMANADMTGPPATPHADAVAAELAQQDAQRQQQLVEFTQRALAEAQALKQSHDIDSQGKAKAIEAYVQHVIQAAHRVRANQTLAHQAQQDAITGFTQKALQQVGDLKAGQEAAHQAQQDAITGFTNKALGIVSDQRFAGADSPGPMELGQVADGLRASQRAYKAAKDAGLSDEQAHQFADTIVRNFVGRMREGGEAANPKGINPATGKPTPKGASPGFINLGAASGKGPVVKVVDAITARTILAAEKWFGNREEAAFVVAQGLRDAATTLGPDAEGRIADMTYQKHAIMAKYVNPLDRDLAKIGYDPANPDRTLENKIDTVFRTAKLTDIRDGKVNLQAFGVDPKFNDAIRFMADGLSKDRGLPALIGFDGLESYHFKEGYSFGENPEIFNTVIGKSGAVQTPDELKNGSIFYHRENVGEGLGEKSVFTRYASHVDRMANQAVAAPVVRTAKGYAIAPNSNYEYFKTITDDPKATQAQKNAAQLVINNILNRFHRNDVERSMKQLQANYVEGILNNRVSAGLKNYPSVFALSNVNPVTLLNAGVKVITDPQAMRIVDKYGPSSFRDLELVRAGVLSPKFSRRGVDVREILESHSRAMTFYGSIMDQAKKAGVPLPEIEAGASEKAKEILRQATLEIKKTQGNWSSFSGRPTTGTSAGAMALMFKQQKLTEIGRLYQMFKTNDAKGLIRYFATKWLIAGPANIIDAQSANLLLANLPNMDPAVQQFLDDARTGRGGVMGYGQQLLGQVSNLDLRSNIATPTIAVSDIPGVGDAISATDWARHEGGVLNDPNATTGERVEALSGAAQRLGAFLPPFKAGPMRVSTNFLARGAAGVTKATQPDEMYQGHRLEISPASEIARVLFPGNAEKARLRNYNDDAGRLNKDYRYWYQHQSDKPAGDSVKEQMKRFLNNYHDVLSKRYETSDKKEIEEQLWTHLENQVTDDEGNATPTAKEWGHITSLMEDYYSAQKSNNTAKVRQLGDAYLHERDSLMKRYPGQTEETIQSHYDSGHGIK